LSKIFSDEIKNVPYPLPEGWKWVRLKEIAKKLFAGGDKPKNFSKEKNSSYNIPIIANGMKNKGIIGYTNESKVNEPCITISARGTIGHSAMRNESFYPAVRVIVLIPEKDVNLKFLNYALSIADIIRNGANIPQLTIPMVKNLLIPLPFKNGIPDLEKQKQIVEKIEAIFEKIDRAITLRQKALENTKKLFESVLNKIFKEAEEDKENWKWVKLGEIVEILDKHRKPLNKKERENKKGKYPYCGANGIIDYINDFIFDGKYLLIAEDGGFFKKYEKSSYIFEGKFWANNHVHILKIKNDFSTEYINYFFLYEDLEKYCSGATRLKLNQTKLKEIKIPLPFKNSQPDFEKQKQIAEYLDNLHNKIKQLEELQKLQLEKFNKLKESILNKAFRGELV